MPAFCASTREVAIVLAWAGRHAVRGVVAGARASWRVMRAAFPEKDDRYDRRNRREPEEDVDFDGDAERESIQIHPVQADTKGCEYGIACRRSTPEASCSDDDGIAIPGLRRTGQHACVWTVFV